MKIYRTKSGQWTNKRLKGEKIAATFDVPAGTDPAVLNWPALYNSEEWDPEQYALAEKALARNKAAIYLRDTDYIVLQWMEEETLGIEHSRPHDEYMAVLAERQAARETMRKMV